MLYVYWNFILPAGFIMRLVRQPRVILPEETMLTLVFTWYLLIFDLKWSIWLTHPHHFLISSDHFICHHKKWSSSSDNKKSGKRCMKLIVLNYKLLFDLLVNEFYQWDKSLQAILAFTFFSMNKRLNILCLCALVQVVKSSSGLSKHWSPCLIGFVLLWHLEVDIHYTTHA